MHWTDDECATVWEACDGPPAWDAPEGGWDNSPARWDAPAGKPYF